MKTFQAVGATVGRDAKRRRITLQLWTDGAEATLEMSESEALQKAADILKAIADNRNDNGGQ